MTNIATATVSEYAVAALRERVEKLNARALRHGMSPLQVNAVEVEPKEAKSGDLVPQFEVTIVGNAPRLEGWVIAAKVERDEIIGILVKAIPGPFAEEDYSEYRESDFYCDHCNSRRGRKCVFVMRHTETLETKVVGRNCLADFVRNDKAEDFARFVEAVDAIQEWFVAGDELDDEGREIYGGSGDWQAPIGLERFLATAQCCTRRLGWLSRTAAKQSFDNETSTADNALYVLCGHGEFHKKFITCHEIYVNDADRELAREAIEWAAGLTDLSNEYIRTIHEIAVAGFTNRKLAGYSASIIRAYQKAMEWEEGRAEKAKTAKAKVFAGEPGKTRDLGVATVKRVRYIEGYYGTKTIVALDLPMGEDEVAPLVWFASGSREFNEGEQYHVRAGIKDCTDDERFGKQTVLTRAKLTEVT